MRKLTLLFICLLSVLNISAEVYSGSCGTKVNYTLDTETGILSISGKGAMESYGYNCSEPWYSQRSYIKTVEIVDGVTSIGSGAFYGCSDITSITIPNSVTSIEVYAFTGCKSLMSVTILSNSLLSKSYGEWGSFSYIFGNQVREYIIGEGVSKIGQYAFSHCSSAMSINIPNSVTSIGSGAFYSCSKLDSITISKNVTSIGDRAFYGCSGNLQINCDLSAHLLSKSGPFAETKFRSIIIGNDIKAIGDYAFYNNPELTSITIGSSIESLGDYAFNNIKKLDKIYCYAQSVPTASRNTFENSYIDYATLYVPASSLDAYKSTAPWKSAANILPLEDEPGIEKCATPVISIVEGRLNISCETEDVEYICRSEFKTDGNNVMQPQKLQITVTATKEGYVPSDAVTAEIELSAISAIKGDVNSDGIVNGTDIQEVINIIVGE